MKGERWTTAVVINAGRATIAVHGRGPMEMGFNESLSRGQVYREKKRTRK